MEEEQKGMGSMNIDECMKRRATHATHLVFEIELDCHHLEMNDKKSLGEHSSGFRLKSGTVQNPTDMGRHGHKTRNCQRRNLQEKLTAPWFGGIRETISEVSVEFEDVQVQLRKHL
jgi:hypothetical protein